MTDPQALNALKERVERTTEHPEDMRFLFKRLLAEFDISLADRRAINAMCKADAFESAALALVEKMLPGFWATSGLCALSGHASIGPDYNGPNGDRLRQEWPEDQFHGGFDADLTPGDGRHRQCLAILHCLIQALLAKPQKPHVTLQEIEAAKTADGGWTREQLAKWGVSWPPPKGWKAALTKEQANV